MATPPLSRRLGSSNNFTVNGAADNDPFLNLNNSGPSNLLLGLNDVGEISVVANAYSAQYGTLGGIQENIVSRWEATVSMATRFTTGLTVT